jgi:hypothetical protein
MSKDILNLSSLARYILPEVTQLTQKKVSEAAILMALTRLSKKITSHTHISSRFTDPPQITLRSPLFAYTVESDEFLKLKIKDDLFFRATFDGKRYVIIGDSKINLGRNSGTFNTSPLAGISIQLSDTVLDTPGAYYFFLKSLAWEQINIFELFTQRNEFTIFVYEKDAEKAYTIIRSLFL